MAFSLGPKSKARQVMELKLPTSTLWQCAVRNSSTLQWFVSQAKERTDTGEDTLIHRFDRLGNYLDFCTVYRGGHGTAFGVMNDNTIWATCEGKIVTFPYIAGGSFDIVNTTKMNIFNTGNCQVSFSPTREYLVVREQKSINGVDHDIFTRRFKQDILTGVNRPLGKQVKVERDGTPNQGFTLKNSILYRYMGFSDTMIEKYDFKTGALVGEWINTDYIGSGNVVKWEAEGMDAGKYFGMKVWLDNNNNDRADDKALRIFKFDW